ncbi:hypothetical protein EI42_01891 [Thermosporothrix hazakensis]|jgi:hypothetical protein|uniref:Uncharacterized protein n=1 Tax=Thermosporothrix hazakensis TaxID=644383 RepID=A0A326UB24_THEHA|nr:hypothetical protein [Thermosporothrix hazakensis]PZW32799.1 hypothetical protein EI42_01891 [Thermosporothrix hazakensis]GCE50155.1 hypothetical protein KTH_50240 [Thermosporothrix hazakensis]
MITEKLLERLYLLSDDVLYRDAVNFMHSIGEANSLSGSQMNGLLNIALGNPYSELLKFLQHQQARTTWKKQEAHVPGFYRKLQIKLQRLTVDTISSIAPEGKLSPEEQEELKKLIAQEFIQHLLAENGYMAYQIECKKKQEETQQSMYQRGGKRR